MSGQFRTEADVMVATASRVDNTNAEVQSELARLRGIAMGFEALGQDLLRQVLTT